MVVVQTNIFTPLSLTQWDSLELIDIFSARGKKTIILDSHSSLTYLIVASSADIDIEIVTTWPECTCRVFGLFLSNADKQVAWSIMVSLKDSSTSAEVDLVSFLYDWAKLMFDGSIDIGPHLHNVHGRLLQQNVVLGKDISVKVLPQLTVASHDVRAVHGAKIDSLDTQKLFYMMSRGLTKQQSQKLLVDGYIEYAFSQFSELTQKDKKSIYNFFFQ